MRRERRGTALTHAAVDALPDIANARTRPRETELRPRRFDEAGLLGAVQQKYRARAVREVATPDLAIFRTHTLALPSKRILIDRDDLGGGEDLAGRGAHVAQV